MARNTGTVVNKRYRIVKLLGQGGFGTVYRAWDLHLERSCALKENVDNSAESQRQFSREAKTLAQLRHPNLVNVTDYFILPSGGQYIVMEYVEGETLEEIVAQRGRLDVAQSLEWIRPIANALDYAHGESVVHRDIKPANIIIRNDGTPVLVDFGLVKIHDPHLKTTIGARAVTPGYSPPEQYGHGTTDARTDIYALGATLYHLLTGFDPVESIQRISGRTMQPTHVINPSVPVALSNHISRAMAIKPDERIESAEAFAAGIASPSPMPVTQRVNSAPIPTPAPPLTLAPAPPVKRQGGVPLFWMLGGILGAIALTALLVRTFGLPDPEQIVVTQIVEEEVTTIVETVRELEVPVEVTQVVEVETVVTEIVEVEVTRIVETEVTRIVERIEPFGGILAAPATSGELIHNEEDGNITAVSADVYLSDYMVTAEFITPFDASTNQWDCGFLLNHLTGNQQYRLAIRSNGEWTLINRDGDDSDLIDSGSIRNLNTRQGERNVVRVVKRGDEGSLYINGELTSELDFSQRGTLGDVQIATGIYSGTEVDNEVTRYENFTVWGLPISEDLGASIVFGETETGVIDEGTRGHWFFSGLEQEAITIRVSSEDFDTHVTLLSRNGEVIERDDDSGSGTNSLINNFRLPETGDYIIMVRAFSGSTAGTYTVSLTR